MKIRQVQSDIDFEVVNTYTTNLPFITTMVCVDDNSAWIDCFPNEVIKQINIDNDNVTTTNEVSCKIYDMALTSNNDILLSLSNSSDVKLLTKSGEIKPFLSVSPLRPWGIHVTRDNDIIVTGAWGMDFVSSSPFSLLLPLFLKFSYKSFLFQNFHNHSFFLHVTISVDVIHHE